MKRKNVLMIIMAMALVFALAACGPKTETSTPATSAPTKAPTETPTEAPTDEPTEAPSDDKTDDEMTGEKVFTLDELAMFNGKDGQPAYIAVDGIVYDVTNVSAWKNGGHQGFDSGKDVTDQIGDISPHGIRVLDNLTKVGTLAK